MWSTIIWIFIILIFLLAVVTIFIDLKQKKAKSSIIGKGFVFFAIIIALIIANATLLKERKILKPIEGEVGEEQPLPAESDQTRRLLFQLQDYTGELASTNKPQVQQFFRQGVEHKLKGEYAQALETFNQALDLDLSDGERLSFLILMGNSEAFLKEYESAINYQHQAERLGKETNNDTVLAVVWSNLASVCQLDNDLDGALESYLNLLELFRRRGDKLGEKAVLADIGFIYQEKGNADSAEAYHKRSLEVLGTEPDFLAQASEMNSLALIYKSKGKLDSALIFHEKSLLLFQHAGDKKNQASVLGNMGLVYQDMGKLERALEYHRQAFLIDSMINDFMGQAVDLTNIGSVLEQERNYNKAKEAYQGALSIFEKMNAKKESEFVRGNIERVEKKSRE